MNKRIFVITSCVLIVSILATAFCFWPMKKHEVLEFQAVQVTADGTIMEHCTIAWDGETKANIFQYPRYIGIRLNISNFGEIYYTTVDNGGMLTGDYIKPITNMDKNSNLEGYSIHQDNDSIQYLTTAYVYLTTDRTVCLVKINDAPERWHYYIGTTDSDIDLTKLCEEYKGFFS